MNTRNYFDVWSISTMPDLVAQTNLNVTSQNTSNVQGQDQSQAPAQTPANQPNVADRDRNDQLIKQLETGGFQDAANHLRELRGEIVRFRHERNQYRETADSTAKELEAIKTAKAAEEAKKLEDERKFQELYQNTKQESTQLVTQRNEALINAELKSELLDLGFPKDFVKDVIPLVNKNGIAVDSAGNITGLQQALDRTSESPIFKTLLEALIAKRNTADSSQQQQQADQGQQQQQQGYQPADNAYPQGSMKSYGELRKQFGTTAGTTPNVRPNAPAPKPQTNVADRSAVNKQQYAAERAKLLKSLSHK